MRMFSHVFQNFSKLKKQTPVSVEPIFEKKSFSKVKVGSIVLSKDLWLKHEGTGFAVRSFDMPKSLTVVEKHFEKKNRFGNESIFLKLEDEKGNRYNLRGSLDSKVQVQSTSQS